MAVAAAEHSWLIILILLWLLPVAEVARVILPRTMALTEILPHRELPVQMAERAELMVMAAHLRDVPVLALDSLPMAVTARRAAAHVTEVNPF